MKNKNENYIPHLPPLRSKKVDMYVQFKKSISLLINEKKNLRIIITESNTLLLIIYAILAPE